MFMSRLKLKLATNPWEYKIFRFGCIGAINTLVDLTILNFLVFVLHFNPIVANLISATISISISYFLNHKFVFKDPKPRSVKQFAHFFLVTGISILAIQSIIIALFTHLVGLKSTFVVTIVRDIGITSISDRAINLNTAKLIAVLISMVWNFAWYHKAVFKEHKADDSKFNIV